MLVETLAPEEMVSDPCPNRPTCMTLVIAIEEVAPLTLTEPVLPARVAIFMSEPLSRPPLMIDSVPAPALPTSIPNAPPAFHTPPVVMVMIAWALALMPSSDEALALVSSVPLVRVRREMLPDTSPRVPESHLTTNLPSVSVLHWDWQTGWSILHLSLLT